jgi:vacuolar-type H+-ATPase subunit I/STV1
MIHCHVLHYLTYGLTSLYLLILVYLFGLIMVSLCYCFNLINEHDVNIYDTIMLSQ